jgi:lipopolysaccharide/colanic/teichoic acid biosynthesis glycosyltransferase
MTQSIRAAQSSGQTAPVATALLPHARPSEAESRRFPAPSGTRPRVVILESGTSSDISHDRLDEELDIVARLKLPLETTEVEAVFAAHRPSMLLSTAPLETLDNSFMRACFEHRVRIFVLALPAYGLLGPARLHRFGGVPWLRLGWLDRHHVGALAKRALDVLLVLASAPLVLTAVLLISSVICWDGPPLYFQDRVGEGGRTFRLVKLRTMRVDAERHSGPVLAGENDSRTTRVGRTLRRLRLDELPQLWNVLRGEMSLVGPRPERPEFIVDFRRLPHYETRHLIRPGITGIAQLTGGYSATVEEKLRCDLLYMNCRSLRLDLKLLTLTAVDLVRGFPRG